MIVLETMARIAESEMQEKRGKQSGHCRILTRRFLSSARELMCDDRQETRAGENEEQREGRS